MEVISKSFLTFIVYSQTARALVKKTYHPPQIPDIDTLLTAIETRLSDYRRVFIEQPRLRLDGVYIATCHYV